jgi:hypothetical protein
MAFEGADHDMALFDEPVPKAVYTAVWRGLIDRTGAWLMGFTPLGPNCAWVHREFVLGGPDYIRRVTASQSDNPHLDSKALAQFREGADFNDEERAARERGEFGHLTHRAFPTFRRGVHVIPPFTPPRDWPILLSVDPAHRRPFFMVWMAWDAVRSTWIVFREFPHGVSFMGMRTSSMTIQDYANTIRSMEGARPADGRLLDPRFGPAEYSIKGQRLTSVLEDFGNLGLIFECQIPGIASIETGVAKIRELLAHDRQLSVSATNRPHLLVTEDCTNVIEAFENWSFVPPAAREELRLDEKYCEPFKDPIDVVRYAVLYGPPAVAGQARHLVDPAKLAAENDFGLSW